LGRNPSSGEKSWRWVFLFFGRILNVEPERVGPVKGLFMLRIYIPNGRLRADQLRCIARLAEEHPGGLAAVKMRRNVRADDFAIESADDISEELGRKGLTRDNRRDKVSITGCPVAGIDAGEICDVSSVIIRTRKMLIEDASSYNLPGKLSFGISGCQAACFPPDTIDIALIATKRKRNGTREIAFTVGLGGQLSSQSISLPAFIPWEQAPYVIKSIVQLFGEAPSVRDGNQTAMLRHGWTAGSLLRAVEDQLGFMLDVPDGGAAVPTPDCLDHVGIHPQKQRGRFYAGLVLRNGHATAAEMFAIADLADRYGSGDLRITNMQNIVLLNVSKNNVDPLAAELERRELRFQKGDTICGARVCQNDQELSTTPVRYESEPASQEDFSRAVTL
jgi:sulfite reductase (ferredoxin)